MPLPDDPAGVLHGKPEHDSPEIQHVNQLRYADLAIQRHGKTSRMKTHMLTAVTTFRMQMSSSVITNSRMKLLRLSAKTDSNVQIMQ